MTWGGDHPDGPVPLGIPGFRGKHRKGRHKKQRKGCLGALAGLVCCGLAGGLVLGAYAYFAFLAL